MDVVSDGEEAVAAAHGVEDLTVVTQGAPYGFLVSIGLLVAVSALVLFTVLGLGLLIHSTAGFIDPGFSGHVTLELSNVATLPIKLWPGMKIGQLCLFRLSSPAEHPYGSEKYGSRYQGQRGPTASRSFQSFQRTPVD